ncbi:c-di-AMP phosphodiesterase-like protein [Chryseobacterium rhizosphaerae]|uniref:C-di-AMP phosphodiesterase-like protein n=1 Tax=Chryseobacterium rhizosphaerae TaxID=395937 RepID=A0AAE3Y9S9_9FLAO|nr:c-di-AMP phosphodiesterase-like protein [Chryseobacterium rhizosphaerae]
MDFIIKLLYSLFFAAISFILFMKYNKAFSIKPKLLIILLLNLILLFCLNTIYTSISNKLFYILLMFSLSVVILNIMKNFINMENNAVLKNNDRFRNNYKNVKNIFFIKVIPIIIFFYQLLLIWVPSISAKMLHN